MMQLIHKFYVLCFGILLSLALTGSGQPGIVLCLGEDGHIAIETVDGRYHTSHSQAEYVVSANEELPSENDCGQCIDIPISIGSAILLKAPCEVDYAFPASVAFATVNGADFSGYRFVPESSVPPPYFTPLRAIILLI